MDDQSKEAGKDQESIHYVPHLAKDTTWKSNKNTRKHHIYKSHEAGPDTAGDLKAAMNRQDSMTDTKHQ